MMLMTEDVMAWPEWQKLTKRLGVPEVDHPLKIVLTLETECPVHVEHHYYASSPDDDVTEENPDDVKMSTMRRQ